MHILSPVTDNCPSWKSGRRNESMLPDRAQREEWILLVMHQSFAIPLRHKHTHARTPWAGERWGKYCASTNALSLQCRGCAGLLTFLNVLCQQRYLPTSIGSFFHMFKWNGISRVLGITFRYMAQHFFPAVQGYSQDYPQWTVIISDIPRTWSSMTSKWDRCITGCSGYLNKVKRVWHMPCHHKVFGI